MCKVNQYKNQHNLFDSSGAADCDYGGTPRDVRDNVDDDNDCDDTMTDVYDYCEDDKGGGTPQDDWDTDDDCEDSSSGADNCDYGGTPLYDFFNFFFI